MLVEEVLMTFARRMFLRGSAGLAASVLAGRTANAAGGDAIRTVQSRIDLAARNAFKEDGARLAIIVGIVTPDSAADGRLLFAGQDTLVNPFSARLAFDARTPLAIGSISKVFTSGIHHMLRGPYKGALGSRMTLSSAMASLSLKNLAKIDGTDAFVAAYDRRLKQFLRSLRRARHSDPASRHEGAPADRLHEKPHAACRRQRLPAVQSAGLRIRRHRQERRRHAALPALQHGSPATGADGSGARLSTDGDLQSGRLFGQRRRARAGDELRLVPCPVQTAQGPGVVLNKNGEVAGFTSWMGFTRWQGTGKPSRHGGFVLGNGPRGTAVGMSTMKLLLGG